MNEFGIKSENASIDQIGLKNIATAYWNLRPAELVEEILFRGEGVLTDTGAIAVDTGEFTGRSPKDRFVVCDDITENTVWWGDINIKISPDNFDKLFDKVASYLQGRDVYVRDAYACAHKDYRLNFRLITETPWSNLFAYNMLNRPSKEELLNFQPDWHIVCAPDFHADAKTDGTRQHNFAILNFTRKMILIGGTGYTGEIKKGVFSVLNYLLPQEKGVLSMHCSANVGVNEDTAIFFGLSGTGKTTLSADVNRSLIGDDEHGWSEDAVFNFEGGCYAKCIDLSQEKEPQIYNAIKFGAVLENIEFIPNTCSVDYFNCSKTENTRVSYPIYHIDNIMEPSIGSVPKNIFFLTCDAYGVLPPISKLNTGQAMYQFISGYTAKVAGTEEGIVEPETVFSACFGAPFLPLHPTKYAEMLGEKIKKHNVNVWLVNTGWSGGPYGVGERISLKYTRALITAALNASLNDVEYTKHKIFKLDMPVSCPDVPGEILSPKNTWSDKENYDKIALKLAAEFIANFNKFADDASEEILAAAPIVKDAASI